LLFWLPCQWPNNWFVPVDLCSKVQVDSSPWIWVATSP
jgi:hypothetical protein